MKCHFKKRSLIMFGLVNIVSFALVLFLNTDYSIREKALVAISTVLITVLIVFDKEVEQ